jgi:endoglucanase
MLNDFVRKRRRNSGVEKLVPKHHSNIWRHLAQHIRWIALAILSLLLTIGMGFGFNPWLSFAQANTIIQPPLSTQGDRIVDTRGQTVLLRGVNWFGLETSNQSPHGLWLRDYKDMLAQIRRLDYNVIRLPFSLEALRSNSTNGIDFGIGNNRELQGLTPLEVMDAVIAEADRQGLMILLDSHTLRNQTIPELWYGDGYTEEDWINTWTMLAQRYRNQRNVIGADLKNEPHGQASWGTGDRSTDWRLAAERAGNAILEVNPDWLIVVEGVENNVPGQQLSIHWQGGNLEGVRRFPVRLSNPRKLVYSPHEYGPGVFNQPWFSAPNFPRNLLERWEIGFHYIATEGIAPIWIGEFGGRQVDRQSTEGIWQRQLVDYIKRHRLSFTYWSWNPNSADTGGILLDDWQTIDQPKQQLLNQLLPVPGLTRSAAPVPTPTPAPSGSPSPSPSPTRSPSQPSNRWPTPQPSATATPTSPRPTPQPNPSPSSQSSSPPTSSADLSLVARIQSDWQTGFCASFQVHNPGSRPIESNWQLTFRMNQATINNSWNGTFERQGSRYTVRPPDWAQTVWGGQTIDIGFCADKQGTDYRPTEVRFLNERS